MSSRMSFGFGIPERKQFVVQCKLCSRDVLAGVERFPFQSIVVTCPMCGEQRRYLPSEAILGRRDHILTHQARTEAR